ncbi:hypothetical protein B484DRAFT_456645 [Ochromonadaceae sp. CCMP2298]|nr:hypothetical protein B484DRAFT_456645 [Ochromonadaceae sp. CCMP2298]
MLSSREARSMFRSWMRCASVSRCLKFIVPGWLSICRVSLMWSMMSLCPSMMLKILRASRRLSLTIRSRPACLTTAFLLGLSFLVFSEAGIFVSIVPRAALSRALCSLCCFSWL